MAAHLNVHVRDKTVLVLYTGGTMGMKPDLYGYLAPSPG